MLKVTDLPALKKAYKTAKESNQETFMFKGHELLVNYAKYVIEYLELPLHAEAPEHDPR